MSSIMPITSGPYKTGDIYLGYVGQSQPQQQAIEEPAEEPAAILTLSKEAEAAKSNTANGYSHKIDEKTGFLDIEAYRENTPLLMDETGDHFYRNKEVGSLGSSNMIEYVTGAYLYGKVDDFTGIAKELGNLLKSYSHGTGTTVEERVANRESGIKLAEYLANKYMSDDPVVADDFMKRVRQSAEYDELREKGYEAIEGTETRPRRPYEIARMIGPDVNDQYKKEIVNISREFMAEKLGVDYSEIEKYQHSANKNDWRKYDDFISKSNALIERNHRSYVDEIIKSFADSENKIANAMTNAKAALSEDQLMINLQSLIGKYGL